MSGSGWALAIDFGTSFTTGAMLAGDGPPVLVEVEHSRYLPSVVVVDRDGQVLTGEAARRQAVVFPERAVRVPKRALVAGPSVVLGDAAVPVTRLVAAVLGRIYAEAVRLHGGAAPSSVTLTHPARWGEVPLGRLREAAAEATGSDSLVFVPEPVAAARWYGESLSAGDFVAVFDLGGGTLDTAVLRADGGGFTIAGPPGGDASLGGEDLDELLFGRVSEIARDRDELAWSEVFDGAGARARHDLAMLRSDVTVAKEALSEVNAYEVVVPGFAEAFRITRPELNELFGPKLDGAVAEMSATIAATGTEPGSLRGLYLTGGASRMPLVAARLAATLAIEPQMRDDPKAAVVLGALTQLKAGAAETRHELSAKAAAALGDSLRDSGDLDGARAAYQEAASAGDLLSDRYWAWNLGRTLASRGDTSMARAVFESIAQAGGGYAFEAARSLGDMLREEGDTAGSAAAYEQAINVLRLPRAGDGWGQVGRLKSQWRFGLTLAKAGHTDLARSVFELIRDHATGQRGTPYADGAKSAISHLARLQADLNGAKGKITVNRKWLFGWGSSGIEIDGTEAISPVNYAWTASATRDVEPGPHIIESGHEHKGHFVVYVAPAQHVQVRCNQRMSTAQFTRLS